jgi:hypothetical protein
MGTPKPSVVETKVSQSAGSKASLADVGLMVPSQESGFQKSSRALALSACYFAEKELFHGVRCALTVYREFTALDFSNENFLHLDLHCSPPTRTAL